MQKIYTGKQRDDLYRLAQQHDHLSPEDRIERAARSFEQEFRRLYPPTGHTIYVFAGAGRSGAYALGIARYLAQRGYTVCSYLFYREGKLSEECEAVRKSIAEEDLRLEEIYTDFTPPRIQTADVLIDGLFGAELSTPLFGGYLGLVDFLNASGASIVSIELPSGLFAEDNSGNDLEHVIKAKYTIAFDSPYLAFYFEENEPYVGEWIYLPQGISPRTQDSLEVSHYQVTDTALEGVLKRHTRFSLNHEPGKVLFLTNQPGSAGKTLLATKAALHTGCSEVHVLVPNEEALALQLALPELTLPSAPKASVLGNLNTYQTIVIGEGFGRGEEAAATLRELLITSSRPLLLSGDGLQILSRERSLLERIPVDSVLLLNPSEFDSLTTTHRSDAERLDRALELAERLDIYIVLRGAYTAICLPSGVTFFDVAGNSGLRSTGCTEVLLGVIAGLLGDGYKSVTAATLGVHLCALAAELYAGRYSERSLTATALIDQLSSAYRQLEAH